MSPGPAKTWNVIVWDDSVNLMNYVTWVLRSLFGRSHDEASRLMLLVHSEGRAVVEAAPRERAEMIAFRLLHHGLRVTLEER